MQTRSEMFSPGPTAAGCSTRAAQLIGEHPGALPIGAAQDQAELLTPVPADQVARPGRSLEDLGHVEQGLVSDQVPVPVVHPFEVIHVHHHGTALAVTAEYSIVVLQLRHQRRVIEQAGEPVTMDHFSETSSPLGPIDDEVGEQVSIYRFDEEMVGASPKSLDLGSDPSCQSGTQSE